MILSYDPQFVYSLHRNNVLFFSSKLKQCPFFSFLSPQVVNVPDKGSRKHPRGDSIQVYWT